MANGHVLPRMTAADLLRAVSEITRPPGPAVATNAVIYAWLALNQIDPGAGQTWRNKAWWEADRSNAVSRLRKFKMQMAGCTQASGRPPCSPRGGNGWALIERWDDACHWTTSQTPRWRAIPWCTTCASWIFECSALVQRGEVLAVFDARTLAACARGFGSATHLRHIGPATP